MNVRVKFAKYGAVKFIGHLDVMRYFQKANRRAELNIVYSQGFNPHQIMSFAAPLGVGLTSDGEYVDLELHEMDTPEEMIARLNATMNEGFLITGFKFFLLYQYINMNSSSQISMLNILSHLLLQE